MAYSDQAINTWRNTRKKIFLPQQQQIFWPKFLGWENVSVHVPRKFCGLRTQSTESIEILKIEFKS